MKVVRIEQTPDCVDGGFMKDFHFDQAITEGFIRFLGSFGDLNYYPGFARRLFTIKVADKFIAKGIEGSSRMSVVFSRTNTEQLIQELAETIDGFKEPECTRE